MRIPGWFSEASKSTSKLIFISEICLLFGEIRWIHIPANSSQMNSDRITPDRLNALSDGVIAIALTLLVLGIDIPTDHDFTEEGLASFLIKLEPGLIAYIMSFIIVSIYWIVHHRMFNVLKFTDRMIVLLNIVFLFSISLVPFIAKLKALYRYDALAIMIYGAGHIVTGLILFVIWKYMLSHEDLLEAPVEKKVSRQVNIRILILPVVSLAAIVVAFVDVHWGTYFFALIPLIYALMIRQR